MNPAYIPFEELTFSNIKLGEGRYGVVMKAQWQEKTVAIKWYNNENKQATSLEKILSEAVFMAKTHHKNIVVFYGIVSNEINNGLVLEYINNSTLGRLFQPLPQRISLI